MFRSSIVLSLSLIIFCKYSIFFCSIVFSDCKLARENSCWFLVLLMVDWESLCSVFENTAWFGGFTSPLENVMLRPSKSAIVGEKGR